MSVVHSSMSEVNEMSFDEFVTACESLVCNQLMCVLIVQFLFGVCVLSTSNKMPTLTL